MDDEPTARIERPADAEVEVAAAVEDTGVLGPETEADEAKEVSDAAVHALGAPQGTDEPDGRQAGGPQDEPDEEPGGGDELEGADELDGADDPEQWDEEDPGRESRRNLLPRRVESWRRRTASGAIVTAVAMGLQQVFEPERRRPAAVAEAPSDPYDDDDPITVDYVPDDAEATTVHVKPWLLDKGTAP